MCTNGFTYFLKLKNINLPLPHFQEEHLFTCLSHVLERLNSRSIKNELLYLSHCIRNELVNC
jgi:hypothetical protein